MLNELIRGGNPMIVNFTGEGVLNQDKGTVYADRLEADKTLEEVYSAYKAGIPIFGEYTFVLPNLK